MRDFIHDLGPGTWPDWVAAIFTSLAFVIAAVTFALSLRDQRRAQASLVYSKCRVEPFLGGETVNDFRGLAYGEVVGIWPSGPDAGDQIAMADGLLLRVTVHNQSKGLVSNAQVEILSASEHPLAERYVFTFETVDPESVESSAIAIPVPTEYSNIDLRPRLRFTDSVGRHWTRDFAEPSSRMRRDRRAPWPVVGATLIESA